MDHIPKTFEQWKHCLIYNCKINLTQAFAKERISIYENPDNVETKNFAKIYGHQHLNNIILWFKRIINEA